MRKRYIKDKTKHEEEKNKAKLPEDQSENFIEGIMEKAAKDFEIDKEFLPTHIKQEGEENFRKKVKKVVSESGLSEFGGKRSKSK